MSPRFVTIGLAALVVACDPVFIPWVPLPDHAAPRSKRGVDYPMTLCQQDDGRLLECDPNKPEDQPL
jgi:hypothetical protein